MIRKAYNVSWSHPIDLAGKVTGPDARCLVDRGGLYGRDLMLAQGLCAQFRTRLRAAHSEMTVPRLSRRVGHGLIVPSNHNGNIVGRSGSFRFGQWVRFQP